MATSLSKLKTQIQKLQRQADTIQNKVIVRIKREIAKHGLSAEDLFGLDNRSADDRASVQPKISAKAKSGANKPAKFADDKGNTWHGIGKRPQWIHDALSAGHKLEAFLVDKVADLKALVKTPAKKARKATAKKVVASKKAVPAKKASAKKATKNPVAVKPVVTSSTAKTTAKSTSAAKVPRKASSESPAKKAAAKRGVKSAPSPAAAVSVEPSAHQA